MSILIPAVSSAAAVAGSRYRRLKLTREADAAQLVVMKHRYVAQIIKCFNVGLRDDPPGCIIICVNGFPITAFRYLSSAVSKHRRSPLSQNCSDPLLKSSCRNCSCSHSNNPAGTRRHIALDARPCDRDPLPWLCHLAGDSEGMPVIVPYSYAPLCPGHPFRSPGFRESCMYSSF